MPNRLRVSTRLALFVGAFLLYALFPTRVFYWDGVAFAIDIERTEPAFWAWSLAHPNHLLYTVGGNVVYRLLEALGVHTRALYVLQALNAALAAAAVVMLYGVLRRRTADPALALWLAVGFGVCATWWKFSTDADAYIASVLLLIVTFELLDRTRPRMLIAALTHAAAMLLHQLALLFLPVAVWLLLPRGLPVVAAYGAVTGSLVLAVYGIAYAQVHPAVPFSQWITYHSPDSAFTFEPLRNLLLSLLSSVRLIAGGKLSAVVPDAAGLAGLVVLGAALWTLRRSRPSDPPSAAPAVRLGPIVLWVATYAAFLWLWLPRNTFYRLFYLPPLVLLAAHGLRAAPRLRRVLPALVLALAAWNWTFLIYPQSRVEANAPLSFALRRASTWPPGTAVAFARFHPDLWTISYFSRQISWVSMESRDAAQWEAKRQELQRLGMTMWLDDSALDTLQSDAAGQRWLGEHLDRAGSIAESHRGGTFRFFRIR